MLAALGQLFQYAFQLGDPVFSQGNSPLKALEQVHQSAMNLRLRRHFLTYFLSNNAQVYEQRPGAIYQIIIAIAALEVQGQANQVLDFLLYVAVSNCLDRSFLTFLSLKY
jgi:hypothetical protein